MKKIACLALLACPVACSSSGGSTPDAAPPVDTKVVQACDHAAALCDKLFECAPFLLAAGYGDQATCAQRVAQVCTEQSKSTGSGLNLASILACEAALGTVTCDEVFANNVPACAFHGSVADGGACGDNSQCASGFCSHTDSMCGVCFARAGNGGACPSGSNDECQTGLVCSSGKTCVAPAALGGVCDDATAPCLPGNFCTSGKTCALTVAPGTPCPGGYLNGANGTVCWGKDTASNPQLAVQLGTAAAGRPCGLAPADGSSPTLCAPGGVAACVALPNSINILGIPTNGICTAPVNDGDPCTANSACMTGAICIKGTCNIPSGRYCSQVDAGSP